MENYFKKIGKILYNGFYSLGKGMSTFSIYPQTKIRVLTDKKTDKENAKKIKDDWEAVGKDLKKAMKNFSLENKF